MERMPRISVVVPIYNVERYLSACLDSIAGQTVDDFEVVMVNDGSTDGSAELAGEYARRDQRFRLVHQENAGLSAARNTGIEAAVGEFMAFLDSDDVLPPNAYELLLGALDETGSDFATGNVHRLTRWGTSQSVFLAKTFARTQLKTHVTRFRPLIADRIAWNKLWRRSFWDRHGYRFPEGRLHEDIPVVVPAQFAARSVDVIADPVYYWRIREGGELSITQRRLEQRTLLDRMAAVEQVSRHLDEHGPFRAKRWYDESLVADDLRLHLNVLDVADDDYRELFLERVNAFLDGSSKRIYDRLPAIDRLKWHLVRRRLMPELLEVLRFQKESLAGSAPVRIRGRWYGDYPFRGDSRLRIPASVYRLKNADLPGVAHLEELRRDGDRLAIRGFAYVNGIGAPSEGSQRVSVSALRPGRLRRVRLRIAPLRLDTKAVRRPDATAISRQPVSDLEWSGFEATLDPRALRRRGKWHPGSWELYVAVSAGGIRRRRARFVIDVARPLRAVDLSVAPDAVVGAVPTDADGVNIDVRTERATIRGARLAEGGALELAGEVRPAPGPKARLEARRRGDLVKRRIPLGGPASQAQADEGIAWDLQVIAGGRRIPVLLADAAEGLSWNTGEREVALARNLGGDAALVERSPRPVLTRAGWTGAGVLELEGELAAGPVAAELVLCEEERAEEHAFELERDGDRFTSRPTPARVGSLAGPLPLSEGTWRLYVRAAGAALVPLIVAPELIDRMPFSTVVDHKPFRLGATQDGCAALVVLRDLDDDERGQYHQRRLLASAYGARRGEPLRDAVVFTSYRGRQYSDNPRAIHEELVRRNAPLDHYWVVRDQACRVPGSATALREGSREHYELMARARYFVANDHFPDWFTRRDDQVCVQTWHGTPLKRMGLDMATMRRATKRYRARWSRQVANWQYVLSPNRFSTPVLRRSYAIEGELLELGYPRADALAGTDRDALSERLRARLGLPAGKRVVLYAPTYRDQAVDRDGRYRLDVPIDLERLRAAVGDDTVIMFRKHHRIIDPAPATADGFVRDVSSFPDGIELLLAADALITDYSSLMVDFANTGRPILFFTYDLEAYERQIRGLNLDLAEIAPGPLLHTTDELAAALRDLDGVQAEYARRYDAFAAEFCELDDGCAAARVVDRIFGA
jgi:CDP-glycerol glycerophosphotransferase